MRMPLAWANTVAQNVTLKAALLVLCLVAVSLALATAKLAIRQPIIIERGCISSVVDSSSTEHSATEIESFMKEALRQRFNSDAVPVPDYLSSEEILSREQEQKELSSRSMNQTVIVRGIKIDGNTTTIDTDRVIAVAQIRSAFVFPITATIKSTTRTQNNPYGLQIVRLTPPKTEQK